MKKKLDDLTKAKLIYSGELILISLIFTTIAILELCNVITISNRHHIIFNIITLVGSSWLLFDFFWSAFSKKRRAKVTILDKALMLPIPFYVIPYDIISLSTKQPQEYYQIGMPILFLYIATIYMFLGIYHYKFPLKELIVELEQEKQKQKNLEQKQELNNENEKKE